MGDLRYQVLIDSKKTSPDWPNEALKGKFFRICPSTILSGSCLFFMSLTPSEIDRIIEMAWEDRTPFDAIEMQFGIPEKEVIRIMRNNMKESSFKMWRKRVQGRSTKHSKLHTGQGDRFKSTRQRSITHNSISKR